MSVNHLTRVTGLVKAALKEAALNEPHGFSVSQTFVYPVDQNGVPQRDQPMLPGWFVLVTIRNSGLGEPDIGNGFGIPGVMPEDAIFKTVAQSLFARCRKDRDDKQGNELKAARAAFQQQFAETK